MKTNHILCILLLIISIVLPGCEKILTKENLSAINPALVLNNPVAVNAYLNDIYNNVMPAFPHAGQNSDEAGNRTPPLPAQLKGTATINTWGSYWDYTNIRKINYLFEKIDGGTIDPDTKKIVKGQAFFFRAWIYFSMVRAY